MPMSARETAMKITAINVKLIAEHHMLIKAVTRDKREPDRLQKERLSRMIYRIINKRLKRQLERMRFQIQMAFPGRAGKAIGDYIDIDSLFDEDPEEAQRLIALILAGAQGGIKQTELLARLQVDYGMTNVEAATWARRYSYELIKDLDKTTGDVIRAAVQQFVEDPEYTMRDLFELLEPNFGRVRAERIAVTEVTRAYSKGQQLAGDTLKEQFPDVKVIDRWFTNNDDRVCELCGPLDGEEREHGEGFYTPADYADGYPPRHVNCRCWLSTTTRIE